MFPVFDENPTRVTPWVTYILIALMIAAFFAQIIAGDAGERAIYSFGFMPAVFFNKATLPPALDIVPAPATLVTYLFLHDNALHLVGNLLYLWVFGNNVEEALGRARFVLFYFACGIVAALTQGLFDRDAAIPVLGASGAISGVLAAYLLLYPRARILIMIPLGFVLYPARLSARWVLGAWFSLQLIEALLTDPGEPGVAWWAHLGGFACGLGLALWLHKPEFPLFNEVHVIPRGVLPKPPTQPDWPRDLGTKRRDPGR